MRNIVLLAGMLCSIVAGAQDIKYCGQTEATEALFNRFPHLEAETEAADAQLKRELQERQSSDRAGDEELFIIPVVFHIIHNGGEENISDEQVEDAMFVLNRDFRMMNEDLNQVIPEFQDLTADINIEFRLAKRDPEGNCSNGINRIQSVLTFDGSSDSGMKDLIQWPRDMYMNVWVCADAGGAAGYTFLPQSVNNPWMADEDGIVLLHNYTGSIGTSSVYRSRTLTHEVGHWLGLPHPWGPTNSPGSPSNCQMDDGVDDTPNTEGATSCLLDQETCGSLDNVQNYMDYSYCTRMFTLGQKDVMRNAAQSGVADRVELSESSNLDATGVFEESLLCSADFSANKDVICVGDSIQFFDHSFHGVTSWEWSTAGITLSGNDETVQNPWITFTDPGIFDVTLTAGNGFETVSTTRNDFVRVLPAGGLVSPFEEGFEDGLSEDEWFLWNEHSNVGWEVTSVASYSGESSIRIRNRNNDIIYSKDHLISSTMDLSNAEYAVISYKYAYCNLAQEETDDRLRIDASGNCGDGWLLREVHRGITDLPTAPGQNAPFSPDGPSEWAEGSVIIDSSTLLTEFFRLRFNFEGRGGNNVYLDDINITAYDQSTGVQGYFSDFSFKLAPNPTQQSTRLSFYLPSSENVTISLHDMLGRNVQNISSGVLPQGENVTEIQRNGLPSGIYLVTMHIGAKRYTQRLILQ